MSDLDDIILDSSQQNLKEVPTKILQMSNLKMLYLQKNKISKLPWDFFVKLNQLSWLDLRNNELEAIPRSIGHHQYLENLLLSDNKLKELPNELGLVPRLKVLQVANNPLSYPSSRVIAEGTRSVCSYLKTQHLLAITPPKECEERRTAREESELSEERELRFVEDFGREIVAEESINSSLVVKGLSKKEDTIIHKLSKDPSNNLLLKSYYDEDHYVRASTQTSDYILRKETVKQGWMDKLKQLLEEQEKILQQERNLQALSTWRQERKVASCPLRHEEHKTPYATYPEYDTILSRADLTKQIDKLIERHKNPPKHEDVQKLINDLISELKDMEVAYDEIKSPRSEIEASATQIKKIMEIHKKLLKLQQTNNVI